MLSKHHGRDPLRLLAPIAFLLLTGAAPGRVVAQAAPPAAAAAVQAQLDAGDKALAAKDYGTALDAYKKANALSGGHSAAADAGMAVVLFHFEHFTAAAEVAQHGLAETTDPALLGKLHGQLGISLYRASGQHDRAQLEAAARSFRQALELGNAAAPSIRFFLGATLLALRQDDEALTLLKDYVAQQPQGPYADLARKYLADPRQARGRLAPRFALPGPDGKTVALDDFKGKVVLLDFWATWCQPCRMATPALKRIAAAFEDRPFVLVGVDEGESARPVKKFLAAEKESWPQVVDTKKELGDAFQIEGLPSFVLLDTDGAILLNLGGWANVREQELTAAITSALGPARTAYSKNAGEDAGAPRDKTSH